MCHLQSSRRIVSSSSVQSVTHELMRGEGGDGDGDNDRDNAGGH